MTCSRSSESSFSITQGWSFSKLTQISTRNMRQPSPQEYFTSSTQGENTFKFGPQRRLECVYSVHVVLIIWCCCANFYRLVTMVAPSLGQNRPSAGSRSVCPYRTMWSRNACVLHRTTPMFPRQTVRDHLHLKMTQIRFVFNGARGRARPQGSSPQAFVWST